jgi:hypothetical protein
MSAPAAFRETQSFLQGGMWLLLLPANLIVLSILFYQVFSGEPVGNNPMSNEGLIILALGMLGLSLAVLSMRLETEIREDGVYVRLFPFHLKPRRYAWKDIARVYLRQYSPVREFGGFGLRYGGSKKGWAYNVSGNQGLQLELNNGKKLLIGTSRPEELRPVLERYTQQSA